MSNKYLRLLLCGCWLTLGLSCSERNSFNNLSLTATWDITVDHNSRSVSASARAVDGMQEDIRLVGGDLFRIVWGSENWQLYRRSAPYVYSRQFPLPSATSTFEARLDRPSTGLDSIVYRQAVPDSSSFELAEEGMQVPITGNLNMSWQIDIAMFSIAVQSVSVELLNCTVQAGQSRVKSFPVALAERSLLLSIADLPQPESAASVCQYTTRLNLISIINPDSPVTGNPDVDSPDPDNPSSINLRSLRLQTRSRVQEFTVEFTGNAS